MAIKFIDGDAPAPEPDQPQASDVQVGGDHYKKYVIQPIEFISKNNIPYIEANVLKYVLRHKDKNGKEDLLKARHYIDLLIEMEYK
jgi:hypothetical protein